MNSPQTFPNLTRRSLLRRAGAGTALLLGSGPLLAACGGGGDDDGTTEVAVSLPAGGNSLSIWKPIVERQKLSAPGVRFRWVGGDPGQLQTQFLSGSVDVSTFGPLGAALAQLDGDAVVIAGPGINNHHKWLVADGSSARSPADLRGRRIATGLKTSESFRTEELLLAIGGGSAEDYEWVHTQGASIVALFERGDVDGILIGEPNASILVAAGARQIGSVQEQWREVSGSDEPLFNAGPTVRTAWRDENPEVARGAVSVLSKASTSLAADPAQLTDVATSIGVKADQAEVAAQLPERMGDVYVPEYSDAVRRQFDEIVALGVKHGVLSQRPSEPVYDDLQAPT